MSSVIDSFVIGQLFISDVSLTLTEGSMSHTTSAAALREKPGLGRTGRWGSGSERSRAVGRRSDWTEGDATPAPSTQGSDSLETENKKLILLSDPQSKNMDQKCFSVLFLVLLTCEGDDENDGDVNEEELKVS